MSLTLQVKLDFKLAKYKLKLSKFTLWNFTIKLELFIDHLKVPDEFESIDLDFDLQICHESLKSLCNSLRM